MFFSPQYMKFHFCFTIVGQLYCHTANIAKVDMLIFRKQFRKHSLKYFGSTVTWLHWQTKYPLKYLLTIFAKIFVDNICQNICWQYLPEYLLTIFAKIFVDNICQNIWQNICWHWYCGGWPGTGSRRRSGRFSRFSHLPLPLPLNLSHASVWISPQIPKDFSSNFTRFVLPKNIRIIDNSRFDLKFWWNSKWYGNTVKCEIP